MTEDARIASSGQELQGEFRADPGAHWPIIGVLAVLALLSLVGVAWLLIKSGPIDVGRVLTTLLLFTLAAVFLIGVGYFWLRLQRRIRLQERGLEYFDGRQTHQILWDDVEEIYEVVTSVKMLGITVDAPKFALALVTKEVVRCEIDTNVKGFQTLGPLVSGEVNRSLRQRARQKLARHQSVPFGPLNLLAVGIRIDQPAARPWWEELKQRFEGQAQPRFAVPGEYAWRSIRAIQLVSATHGDKWADHTTYNQVEIHGPTSAIYGCPVPLFPNFALFTEILAELNHPLVQGEKK